MLQLTYAIPSKETDRAVKLLNKVINSTGEEDSPFRYEHWSISGGEAFELYFSFDVAPNYLLIATINTLSKANSEIEKIGERRNVTLLSDVATNEDILSLFDRTPIGSVKCEICHRSNKSRSIMYIILDTETGEYLRVGSSCVNKISGDVRTLKLVNDYLKNLNSLKLFFEKNSKKDMDLTPKMGNTMELFEELYDENKIEAKTGIPLTNVVNKIKTTRKWPGQVEYNLRENLINETGYLLRDKKKVSASFLKYVDMLHQENIERRKRIREQKRRDKKAQENKKLQNELKDREVILKNIKSNEKTIDFYIDKMQKEINENEAIWNKAFNKLISSNLTYSAEKARVVSNNRSYFKNVVRIQYSSFYSESITIKKGMTIESIKQSTSDELIKLIKKQVEKINNSSKKSQYRTNIYFSVFNEIQDNELLQINDKNQKMVFGKIAQNAYNAALTEKKNSKRSSSGW